MRTLPSKAWLPGDFNVRFQKQLNVRLRTCARCATVHPAIEVASFRWGELAREIEAM